MMQPRRFWTGVALGRHGEFVLELTSLERGDRRVPERAHGKYLLSGGMLICPTCNGHFEARKYPWKGNPREVYCCATRRRKPGVCTNTLALPIAATDDEVLSVIEGEVLGTRVIEELLALVATGDVNESKHLEMDRDRLRAEVSLRVNSIASGVPPETVAPGIRAREAEMPSTKTELLDGLATLHMASPTGNSILWHVELAGKVHRSRAA